MVLTLHYDPLSQPSRALYLFLKAAKIEFEAKKVELMKGDLQTPEYGKINPLRKVPVIEDGKFILTESVAQLCYLSDGNKVPDHWYPKDVKTRARVNEFLNWHHSGLRSQCVPFFLTTLRSQMAVGPLTKIPRDEKNLNDLKQKVVSAVKEIDTYFLKKKKFIAGDDISVADLIGYCELKQLSAICEEDVYKNVSAWMKNVESKLGGLVDEIGGTLKAIKEDFTKAKAAEKGQKSK